VEFRDIDRAGSGYHTEKKINTEDSRFPSLSLVHDTSIYVLVSERILPRACSGMGCWHIFGRSIVLSGERYWGCIIVPVFAVYHAAAHSPPDLQFSTGDKLPPPEGLQLCPHSIHATPVAETVFPGLMVHRYHHSSTVLDHARCVNHGPAPDCAIQSSRSNST